MTKVARKNLPGNVEQNNALAATRWWVFLWGIAICISLGSGEYSRTWQRFMAGGGTSGGQHAAQQPSQREQEALPAVGDDNIDNQQQEESRPARNEEPQPQPQRKPDPPSTQEEEAKKGDNTPKQDDPSKPKKDDSNNKDNNKPAHQSSIHMSQQSAFESLLEQYPFPTPSQNKKDYNVPLFDKIHRQHADILGFLELGREMVETEIQQLVQQKKRAMAAAAAQNNQNNTTTTANNNQKPMVVILEVGVWFGKSLARWLNVDPAVHVIGVDPFGVDTETHGKFAALSAADRKQLKPLLKSLAAYTIETATGEQQSTARQRTLLLQGMYPRAARPLWELPRLSSSKDDDTNQDLVDLFYLDGGKNKNITQHLDFVQTTLTNIWDRYPRCLVAGDDWVWGDGKHAKRFQQLIQHLAKVYHKRLEVQNGRTWMLRNSNPNQQNRRRT